MCVGRILILSPNDVDISRPFLRFRRPVSLTPIFCCAGVAYFHADREQTTSTRDNVFIIRFYPEDDALSVYTTYVAECVKFERGIRLK